MDEITSKRGNPLPRSCRRHRVVMLLQLSLLLYTAFGPHTACYPGQTAWTCFDVTSGDTILTFVPLLTDCYGTVSVPLTVVNAENVCAISLTMSYDGDYLTYTGFQNPNPVLASGILLLNAVNDVVLLSWFSLMPLSIDSGVLIELIFNGIAGVSPLVWDTLISGNCQYADYNEQEIPSVFFNGEVNLIVCSILNGHLAYDNSLQTPLNNVNVLLRQNGQVTGQAITGADGLFEIENLDEDTYTLDASCTKPWGGVNGSDALLIMKHFAGFIDLDGLRLRAADIDTNGMVNANDALWAARRFVGFVNSFPSGDWTFENDTLVIDGSTDVTHDFEGICFGDVDGSFIPAAKQQTGVNLMASGTPVKDLPGRVGIPFTTGAQAAVGSVSLVLDLVSEDIKVVDITAKHQDRFLFNRIGNQLRICWYSLDPMMLNQGDEVFTLWLEVDKGTAYERLAAGDWITQVDEGLFTDANGLPISDVRLSYPVLMQEAGTAWLGQNIPNPFNSGTEIRYYLPETGSVIMKVYDLRGREVMNLVDQVQPAGWHTFRLNRSMPEQGVYLYDLRFASDRQKYEKVLRMVVER